MFTKADPNYDPPGKNPYQDALRGYLNNNRVRLLIDLHGAAREREYAVEINRIYRDSDGTHATSR